MKLQINSALNSLVKNYFNILELEATASDEDVRRAYRRLVKLYHPDTGSEWSDPKKFHEITEAYNYLVDPARRRRHAAFINGVAKPTLDPEARQRQYEAWAKRQEMFAYARMRRQQKEAEEEAFKQTRLYKLFKGINQAYNYLFLLFCVAVICIPIYRYISQQELPESDQQPFIFFVFPILLGITFAVAGYYYLFIYKTDEK